MSHQRAADDPVSAAENTQYNNDR